MALKTRRKIGGKNLKEGRDTTSSVINLLFIHETDRRIRIHGSVAISNPGNRTKFLGPSQRASKHTLMSQ